MSVHKGRGLLLCLLLYLLSFTGATPTHFVAWYPQSSGGWHITIGLSFAAQQCFALDSAINVGNWQDVISESLEAGAYGAITSIINYSLVSAGSGYFYSSTTAGESTDPIYRLGVFAVTQIGSGTSSSLVSRAANAVAQHYGMTSTNVLNYNPISKRSPAGDMIMSGNATYGAILPQVYVSKHGQDHLDFIPELQVTTSTLPRWSFTSRVYQKRAGQCYDNENIQKCIDWNDVPNAGYTSQGTFSC